MPIIKPQPIQELFHKSQADVVIFGGAAGGGKSFSLLMEPLRHLGKVDGFGAVVFRRNVNQVHAEGGLWSTAMKLYPLVGAVPRESKSDWEFGPYGNKVKFAHLEHDKNVLDWQGSQIPLIMFDELTHFSSKQFWYMMSRNRSTCKVRPYIRATTNPDPDSWVRKFIDWWIGPDGLPDPDRAGVVRWFVRVEDELVWDESKEALIKQYPLLLPKSATFIPATLDDNPALVKQDPGYKANLMSLSRVDRERLLFGNWNVKEAAGELFKDSWFTITEYVPNDVTVWVRYWDRAATEPSTSSPDPDYTAGVLMGVRQDGSVVIADIARDRLTPGGVENMIKRIAKQDNREFGAVVSWQQTDPGQAGVVEKHHLSKALAGYDIRFDPVPRSAKIQRAKPLSAQVEAGNVTLVNGPWVSSFLAEASQFPHGKHDDMVDAAAGAYQKIGSKIVDSIDAWQ